MQMTRGHDISVGMSGCRGCNLEDTRPDTLCFKMTSGPQCMLRVAFLVLNSGALALKSHHRSTMITSLNKSKSMKILCYEGE